MAAFLIILGIPLLGVLLYVAEHQRRRADTPTGRSLARSAVLVLGCVVGLAGLVTFAGTAAWILFGPWQGSSFLAVLAFLAQGTASLLMFWAFRSAIRVYRLSEGFFEETEFQHEHLSEQLRLSAAALVLAPIVLLGVSGVFAAVPLLFWGVAFRTSRRARETQFLWTLALAVRQRLPLAEEVDAFAQSLWSRQKQAYHSLSGRLRDGRSLGAALELSSGILPRGISSEIRTAEEAGTLPQVLSEIATRSTTSLHRSRFDSSLAITLVYVWALLATIQVLGGFMMYWIIPKFKDIFNDFGVELPPLTISAIRSADVFTGNFLVVMPLFGLPVLAALVTALVYFIGWGNLNVPLLMRWFPRRDAPSLLRTLSHAVGAARPLPEAVADMSQRHLRSDMRGRLSGIGRSLEQGQPIWVPLQNAGFIRPAEADALAAASRANNLPWAMRTLADSLERTSRHRAQFWLEIAKPTLIVSIGLLVGCFVVAMFLPLVKLISSLT